METNERGVNLGGEKENSPELERQIAHVESFEDLFDVLNNVNSIEGSKKSHSSDDLVKTIKDIRGVIKDVKGEKDEILAMVTRSAGLRDKVRELLEKEE